MSTGDISNVEVAKEKYHKHLSGASYGVTQHSDCDDEGGEAAPTAEPEEDVEAARAKVRLARMEEANNAWRAWRKLVVDWQSEFPEVKMGTPVDLAYDLLHLNLGNIYKRLEGMPQYGHLPSMAAYSVGQLGCLNAESFCERCISAANLVLTEGNTLLGDEELEMLVVLRMNREFMEFMRERYNHLTKQQFARTVVG